MGEIVNQISRRGDRALTNDELDAHIAALLRLENIGILLGAGASAGSIGGKTVKETWQHFLTAFPDSNSWLISEGFIEKETFPDIEKLLDTIEIASLEWKRINNPKIQEILKVKADIHRALFGASMLKTDWWEKPHLVDSSCTELNDHITLLQRITSSRQPGQPAPWVFTTNYDLAIEWAAEALGLKISNGFEGLHNRIFSPHSFDLGFRNMLAKGEARFGTYGIYLAKLHGSLTWMLSEDGLSYVEHSSSRMYSSLNKFLHDTHLLAVNIPVVYPAAAKYIQTVGFVLGELLRRFTEFLSKPQTCLITIGYSFSDDHLNQILARALQNPTLQLVICLPEITLSPASVDVSNCKKWIQNICNLDSPQVTIIGNGQNAWLSSFVKHLPDPAIYDEQANKIRELLKNSKSSNSY